MERYERLKIEVIEFDVEDVITTSPVAGNPDPGDVNLPYIDG